MSLVLLEPPHHPPPGRWGADALTPKTQKLSDRQDSVVVVEGSEPEEATMTVSTSTQRRWFTSYVQSLMSTIMEEPVEPDGDGDFPVPGDTAQAWVRASSHEPWGVQVFAAAAHNVPLRAAVLREINEINGSDPAIRVAFHAPGSVM